MSHLSLEIFIAFCVVVIILGFRHVMKVSREDRKKRERGA